MNINFKEEIDMTTIMILWADAKYLLRTSRDSIVCLLRRAVGCMIVNRAGKGGSTFSSLLCSSKIMQEGYG
jgi:hypothetical protein